MFMHNSMVYVACSDSPNVRSKYELLAISRLIIVMIVAEIQPAKLKRS